MTAETPNVVNSENGNFYPEKPPPAPALVHFMNIVNTVTHLVLGGVAVFALSHANFFNSIILSTLSTHIYLCVCGYIILMSQAVLTFNPFNGWANAFKHPQKKVMHWVMQICGSSLAIIGSVIRINDINAKFITAHGILGLLALIFTVISLIGGVLNLMFSEKSPMMFKIFHSLIGIITLTMAYLCLCFGFHENRIFGDTNANLAIAFTIFALIGVLISACANIFRRILRC